MDEEAGVSISLVNIDGRKRLVLLAPTSISEDVGIFSTPAIARVTIAKTESSQASQA